MFGIAIVHPEHGTKVVEDFQAETEQEAKTFLYNEAWKHLSDSQLSMAEVAEIEQRSATWHGRRGEPHTETYWDVK